MVGLGTLVNSGAILAGAGAGLLLRRGLPEKWQESIMQGVALCIIVIGVQMAFKSENIMVVISVSYTHLRAHETAANLVCRLLLEKKKKN